MKEIRLIHDGREGVVCPACGRAYKLAHMEAAIFNDGYLVDVIGMSGHVDHIHTRRVIKVTQSKTLGQQFDAALEMAKQYLGVKIDIKDEE